MFIISQYLLNLSGTCKNINQINTYSIITGIILYSSIYLYILFYNAEYLSIFHKFSIYIIVVDLLLSTFYYFNLQKSFKYDNNSCSIEEYKKQEDHQEDQESVDMSLVDENSDISETYDETEQDLELKHEPEEDEPEEDEPEYPGHLEQVQIQETKCNKQLNLDIDEIDSLLSIPVLEEPKDLELDVEPKKVKSKRQPRKKKDSVVV